MRDSLADDLVGRLADGETVDVTEFPPHERDPVELVLADLAERGHVDEGADGEYHPGASVRALLGSGDG